MILKLWCPFRHYVGCERPCVRFKKRPHPCQLIMPSDGAFEFRPDVFLFEFHIRGKIEKLHRVMRGQDKGILFYPSPSGRINILYVMGFAARPIARSARKAA